MRFYTADNRTATVQWYFVPNETAVLPFPTVFNNQDWDDWHGAGSALGEDESASRGPYYSGANTTNASGAGPPCGTADQWLHGQPHPPAVPTPVDPVFGVPLCCPRKVSPFMHSNCPAFSPSWDAYCFSVQGIGPAGSCAFYNGDWTLTYVGGCKWNTWGTSDSAPPSGVGWQLDGTAPPNLYLEARQPGPVSPFIYFAVPPRGDISNPFRVTVYAPGNICSGLPTAILVNPSGACDVILIGSIVMDSGVDAVPNLYLLCDGRAVSRAQYSLLFGRVGTTYGAGDGVTTYNLPDLRGRILYGSGGAYNTGQAVGADSPTLTSNQLPLHTHPITDPGHTHFLLRNSANFVGDDATTGITAGAVNVPSAAHATTASAVTGINGTGNNATAGNPLDVRQAGVAVRPLIFAGQ